MGFSFRASLMLLILSQLCWLSQMAFGLSADRDSSSNYPGVIELVGYSNRRARTYYTPSEDHSTAAPPPAKMQADIETVKQNIEKYNKLLTLDTKNLPESQKDMLERIVERVARLKESLDIKDNMKEKTNATRKQQNDKLNNESGEQDENSTLNPLAITTGSEANGDDEDEEEDKTEPTLVLDETTLLQLQTSMDKLAAAQAAVTSQATQMREFPTTTEMLSEDNEETTLSPDNEDDEDEEYEGTTLEPSTDTTNPDEQFVAPRSNNNLAGITAASDESETMATLSTTIGSQRTLTTSGKITKTRATKRPHHSSNKNSGAKRRPSTSSSAYTKNSANKQKVSGGSSSSTAGVTQPSLQSYQKLQQKPLQYGQPSLQQSYQQQSQPPKAVSPSSIGLDKYNNGGSSSSSTSSSAAAAAASYGINPSHNIPASIATSSLPSNSYGNGGGAALSSQSVNSNSQDLVYDPHVNASAIIDSLNNNAREEYYQQKQSLTTGVVNKDKKPITGAKPTKYHYYPHNQHIYLLPECAIQQVCNAVYVRLNYTQPLCACPSRYRDPCSASLNEDDQHTTKLVGDGKKKAITLAKTCEATTEMRECRSPKDWSLLALQNTRTGKSHYLVICRCPDHFKMEGPMAHDQPTYASVPGIRVFGMMCVKPGYSVRKPSSQPPKRYQLQKPFYRPGSQTSYGQSNIGNNNKDAYGRPSYGSSSSSSSSSGQTSSSSAFNSATSTNYHGADPYQSQGNYQYLNRPESISSSSFGNSNNNYRPEPVSINNFPGAGYGRNNEREGDAPIEAATEVDNKLLINTSTQATEETKTTLSEDTTKAEEDIVKREKRSLSENTIEPDDEVPEFPWDRVIEFEKTVVWD